MESRNFTILMYPWLAYGHISPFFELAKKLSTKNFDIYFCSTSINLVSIRKELEKNPSLSIKLLEIHLPCSPDFPPQFHSTKTVPTNLKTKLYDGFQMSKDALAGVLSSVRPDLFLYDALQHSAVNLAVSMGITAVHFCIVGAASNSFFFHFNKKDSPFPYPCLFLRKHEAKSLFVDANHIIKDESRKGYAGDFVESSEICLIKTCRAIEGKYVDYLSEVHGKKVIPVGQLVKLTNSEENDSEIMEWLSGKSKFSTVFISFGSENYLSRHQMGEIANGLELCDVNFIWVVRSPLGTTIKMEEEIPEGFLDRTKERGLIVQRWVPQDKILAHKSVGGFISHCGMSSTLEAAYFGVPVIALPLKLDQPLNARLLVEAGVAVEVEKDENGNWGREEIARALNVVFFEENGGGMLRVKAEELSKKMKEEDEDALVDEAAERLRQICGKRRQKQT